MSITVVDAANDSIAVMCTFLNLDPEKQKFTKADRDAVKRDVERLSQCVCQMDAGQRGNGVSFYEVPFITTRLAVACTRMVLSGVLDAMEVYEDA